MKTTRIQAERMELVRRLFGAATDEEATVLEGLLTRSGVMWRCAGGPPPEGACGATNFDHEPVCRMCRRPGPVGLARRFGVAS